MSALYAFIFVWAILYSLYSAYNMGRTKAQLDAIHKTLKEQNKPESK